MAEIINRLSECEEMIMKIIWSDSEDLDLKTIAARAEERYNREWKLQTVATFMVRLKIKGWIDIYKAGRYSYYHPLVDVEEYKKIKIEEYFDLYAQNKKEEILKKLELYPEMENRKKSKTAVEVVNIILGI